MKKLLGLLTVAVCSLILSTSCNGSKVGDNDKVTLTVEAELGGFQIICQLQIRK